MAASEEYRDRGRFSPSGKPSWMFEESLQRSRNLIEHQQTLMDIEGSQNSDTRRSDPQTETMSLFSSPLVVNETTPIQDAYAIYHWLAQNQNTSPIGLVTSYPDDPGLGPLNQAFTYDQALAGIMMLAKGDKGSAKKLFNFYNSQWDGNGYYTVYNTKDPNGYRVESSRVMGPTAWVALFSLQYYSATGDKTALNLAVKVAKWIQGLPHQNGGAAMGAGFPWGNIFSTENNLDYYAVLNILSRTPISSADRKLFSNELNGVKSWLKNSAYDPVTGLFKRGAGDNTNALDANSWAILVLGVETLQKDFGINVDTFVANIENTFVVQNNGTIGGNPLTSKGFDFSDARNALFTGRTGLKWVEGTNHMVDVYRLLSDYYSQRKTRDWAKIYYYKARADYFAGLNSNESILEDGTLSYSYAEQGGVKIFWDNSLWYTAYGPAVASTAWVYFALPGFNPFSVETGIKFFNSWFTGRSR